jgi:hypothetical protein
MASTKVTDRIIPEVYNSYINEMFVEKSAWWRSGVVANSPALSASLNRGGETGHFPFNKPYNTDMQVLVNESASTTVNKIDSDDQIYVRQFLVDSVGATNIASIQSGNDPLEDLAGNIGNNIIREYQSRMGSSVVGIIADNAENDSGDLVNDIAIEDGDNAAASNLVNVNAAIDTFMKRGDRFDEYAAVAMHSAVYATALKNNDIDFQLESDLTPFGRYLGIPVIVDDKMPVVSGSTSGSKYYTVFFKPGSFQFGETSAFYEPLEVERNESLAGGTDIVHYRRDFAIHPVGFAWQNDTKASVYAPTTSELATASNWDRVFDLKNTGFTVLISNG